MNQLITNNLALFSSLAVCASITFIAWILHKSIAPHEGNIIQHDFVSLMQRISAANTYKAISDLEHEIDRFDYQHNHEVGCGRMLMNLNESYEEKRHSILVDLSLQVN